MIAKAYDRPGVLQLSRMLNGRGHRSACPAQSGADRGEFGMQDVSEIGDDQNQDPNDEAKEDDILRHCGAFIVLARFIEELQKL